MHELDKEFGAWFEWHEENTLRMYIGGGAGTGTLGYLPSSYT